MTLHAKCSICGAAAGDLRASPEGGKRVVVLFRRVNAAGVAVAYCIFCLPKEKAAS